MPQDDFAFGDLFYIDGIGVCDKVDHGGFIRSYVAGETDVACVYQAEQGYNICPTVAEFSYSWIDVMR